MASFSCDTRLQKHKYRKGVLAQVRSWKHSHIEETFFSTLSHTTNIEKAMLAELDKWKDNKV